MNVPTPLEQALLNKTVQRTATIGLPASRSVMERRFPLTPEAAGILVDRGFRVRMESGAAAHIHYTDESYTRHGVEIVSRAEAFDSEIVIYLAALTGADAGLLKRGSLFLSFLHQGPGLGAVVRRLMERKVISLALELVSDNKGNRPFADALHEIDGRAAIAIASSLLADAVHGKGILLGGVAGVVPCEVMIIGSDMAACAAAQTALGMGATVRMFDNDVYRLREAVRQSGQGVISSTLHPRVFESALRSADIVVATDTSPRCGVIEAGLADLMKRGVIAFDLTDDPGSAFPSLQLVDLDLAMPSDNGMTEPVRACYINAGNAVPRTVAMAMSNVFVAMLDDIMLCEGVSNALKLKRGLQRAVGTIFGKCVNPVCAAAAGVRPVDISLFLQFS